MYTSLLKSLTLATLCQMANSIDLHGASYINPKVTVKSELVEQLNEYFNNYPGVFHDIKMNYFSVKGQPIYKEDLILVEGDHSPYIMLREELRSDVPYTPIPEDMEVFEQVHCFEEECVFQPSGFFSLTQHEPSYDEELGLTVKWLPLGSTKFISYHDLDLLDQKPYYLVKYKCKFDKIQKVSLFSTYFKALQFQQSIRYESDESEIELLTLDGDV